MRKVLLIAVALIGLVSHSKADELQVCSDLQSSVIHIEQQKFPQVSITFDSQDYMVGHHLVAFSGGDWRQSYDHFDCQFGAEVSGVPGVPNMGHIHYTVDLFQDGKVTTTVIDYK